MLHEEINHCFMVRKGFDLQGKVSKQEFKPIWLHKLPCLYSGCEKTFKNRAGLNSHIKNYHVNKKMSKNEEEEPEKSSQRDNMPLKTRGIEKTKKK